MKMDVETKQEYHARYGESPDYSDALAVVTSAARAQGSGSALGASLKCPCGAKSCVEWVRFDFAAVDVAETGGSYEIGEGRGKGKGERGRRTELERREK